MKKLEKEELVVTYAFIFFNRIVSKFLISSMITESILNHVIQFITLSEIELNNLPHISGEFIKELCLRASKTL